MTEVAVAEALGSCSPPARQILIRPALRSLLPPPGWLEPTDDGVLALRDGRFRSAARFLPHREPKHVRVGIIDRNGNGENHGVAKKVVQQEVQSAGYRLLEEHDDLVKDDKMDYFLIFAPQ